MTRVLFVIPSLRLGGAERVVALLAAHLPRARFDVHVALVDHSGEFLTDLPPHVTVHDLAAGRVRYALGPLLRLAWQLRPAVIVPNLGYLNLALLSVRSFLPRRSRIVLIEHTTLSVEVSEQRRPFFWRLGYRWLYPRADRIVACSRAIADDLVVEFALARAKLRVISNPIDEPRIAEALTDSSSPFDEPGPHVVGVGRLEHVKGYDRLLDAFARVARELPGALLWLVGDGTQRSELEAHARALGLGTRVRFKGFQSVPYTWMRHADVFVQPSRREGLPVAVMEAAACGARLVAFACPGGTREILEAIPGAQLVPDGNIDALASAIARALGPDAPPRATLPDPLRLARVIAEYSALLESWLKSDSMEQTP